MRRTPQAVTRKDRGMVCMAGSVQERGYVRYTKITKRNIERGRRLEVALQLAYGNHPRFSEWLDRYSVRSVPLQASLRLYSHRNPSDAELLCTAAPALRVVVRRFNAPQTVSYLVVRDKSRLFMVDRTEAEAIAGNPALAAARFCCDLGLPAKHLRVSPVVHALRNGFLFGYLYRDRCHHHVLRLIEQAIAYANTCPGFQD